MIRAVVAINDELQGHPEEALLKWRALKEQGYKVNDDKSRDVDVLDFRPWILLADAKLEAYSKAGVK